MTAEGERHYKKTRDRGDYGEDYSDTIIRLASETRWGRIDA